MINNHKEIWCDDDPINPDDIYIAPNTSMARIKSPKQISDPIYINIDALESMREERRQRVQDFNSRGW